MLRGVHWAGQSAKAVGRGGGAWPTCGWPENGGGLGWGAKGGGCTWGHTQQVTEDKSWMQAATLGLVCLSLVTTQRIQRSRLAPDGRPSACWTLCLPLAVQLSGLMDEACIKRLRQVARTFCSVFAMAFRRAVSRMTVTSSPGLSVKPAVSILATGFFLCVSKSVTGVSERVVSEAISERALQVEHAMELPTYLLTWRQNQTMTSFLPHYPEAEGWKGLVSRSHGAVSTFRHRDSNSRLLWAAVLHTHTYTNSCWCLLTLCSGQVQPTVTESVWVTAMTSLSSPPLDPSTCTLSVLGSSPPPSSLTWCPLLAGDTGKLVCVPVCVWAQGRKSWPRPMSSVLEGSPGRAGVLFVCLGSQMLGNFCQKGKKNQWGHAWQNISWHSRLGECLLDMQLSRGMNLLCDSLIYLGMMLRRTSPSLIFCGQYLWGVGSRVWEILSFFHNLQIFSIFSSFFWPRLTPGVLKPTVYARVYPFPEVAWKHGNSNTGEERCPSNPSWNLCSGDCSPLQRLVLKEHLWLGRQFARQPILNQVSQQTYNYGRNFQLLFHPCCARLVTAGHLWWGERLRGDGERQGVRVPGDGWHILLSPLRYKSAS